MSKKHNDEEKAINPVGLYEYFRFANSHDFIFILVGVIFSIGLGSMSPFNSLLWGEMIDSLSKK